MPLRSTDIRERNEKMILSLVQKHRQLSQSEVVALTGLRAPTVFRIFSALESAGYIRPAAMDERRGPPSGVLPLTEEKKGRKPQYFEVVPEAFYTIGIDFWSQSATLAVGDFAGEIRYIDEERFPPDLNADGVMAKLQNLIDRSREAVGMKESCLLGFGIGAPGRIDIETGMVIDYKRIPGMQRFPIAQLVQERYGVPVYLHNNASLAALAELKYGAARGAKSLFTFLVRSGVGGAYIEHQQPLTFLGKSALEVGHLCMTCDGPPCTCGRQGCLESYMSEDGLLGFAQQTIPMQSMEELETKLQTADRDEILAALDIPLAMFERAIRNIHTLFVPESYLIICRFPALAALLEEECCRRLADLVRWDGLPPEIHAVVYDSRRIGRGATDLVIERFLH
ncbi:MAG: ROK family transcriptional regulator [Termitinemataceae bacterium]